MFDPKDTGYTWLQYRYGLWSWYKDNKSFTGWILSIPLLVVVFAILCPLLDGWVLGTNLASIVMGTIYTYSSYCFFRDIARNRLTPGTPATLEEFLTSNEEQYRAFGKRFKTQWIVW